MLGYINCWRGRCFHFLLSILLPPLFIPLYSFLLFFTVEMELKSLGKTVFWFHLFIIVSHLPLEALYVRLWKLIELVKNFHSEGFRFQLVILQVRPQFSASSQKSNKTVNQHTSPFSSPFNFQ